MQARQIGEEDAYAAMRRTAMNEEKKKWSTSRRRS